MQLDQFLNERLTLLKKMLFSNYTYVKSRKTNKKEIQGEISQSY
jgi:hypothetical protein